MRAFGCLQTGSLSPAGSQEQPGSLPHAAFRGLASPRLGLRIRESKFCSGRSSETEYRILRRQNRLVAFLSPPRILSHIIIILVLPTTPGSCSLSLRFLTRVAGAGPRTQLLVSSVPISPGQPLPARPISVHRLQGDCSMESPSKLMVRRFVVLFKNF